MKYHIRTPSGVSVDMREDRGSSLRLADSENHEVYAVDSHTGRAVKIRDARFSRGVVDEDFRPAIAPPAGSTETRSEERISFSFEDSVEEAV